MSQSSRFRKRHSGELYVPIWNAELPRVPGVHPVVVRVVLFALAAHTNPNRDQRLGVERTWRCWPSMEGLADLTGVSERQVRRVVESLEHVGYITLEQPAVWAGRHRPARAAVWCLHPEKWPFRAHGLDRSDTPIDGLTLAGQPIAKNPMGLPARDDGLALAGQWVGPSGSMGMSDLSAQPSKELSKEPVSKPAAAAAAPPPDFSTRDDDDDDDERIVRCPTCPGGGRNMTRAAFHTHKCRGTSAASNGATEQ